MGTSRGQRHKVTSFNMQMTPLPPPVPSKEVLKDSAFLETFPKEKGTFPGLSQEERNEKLSFYCSLTLGLSRALVGGMWEFLAGSLLIPLSKV